MSVQVVRIGGTRRTATAVEVGTAGGPVAVGVGVPRPALLFVEHEELNPQSVWQVEFPERGVAVSWSLYNAATGRECDEYTVLPVESDLGCRVAMDTPIAGVIRLIVRRTA